MKAFDNPITHKEDENKKPKEEETKKIDNITIQEENKKVEESKNKEENK